MRCFSHQSEIYWGKSHDPGSLRFSLWTGKRIFPRGCNQCEEYERQRIKLKTAHNPCTILT
jgi:hypothetical protein